MKNKKKLLAVAGIVALLAVTIVSCNNGDGLFSDVIEGEWQLVSVDGDEPTFQHRVEFTEDSYTGTTGGVETYSGTWTKSGGTYTLTGEFLGFADSQSFDPTFSSSNNTMTYTNESDEVYVYNRV